MNNGFDFDGKRLLREFRYTKDGADVSVTVDVTDAEVRAAKLALITNLLRDVHADIALNALVTELVDEFNGDHVVADVISCPVVEPAEYAGRTLGEVCHEVEFAMMSDEERKEHIDTAVREFSDTLDDDLREIEGFDDDAVIDMRKPTEVLDSINEHMSAIVAQACGGNVACIDENMFLHGMAEGIVNSWLALLGRYVLDAAANGNADTLPFIKEIDNSIMKRREALEENDVPPYDEEGLDVMYYGVVPRMSVQNAFEYDHDDDCYGEDRS